MSLIYNQTIMKKIVVLLACIFCGGVVFAQSLDDDIMAALVSDSAADASSFDVTLSAGNGIFSKTNSARNANQEVLDKIFLGQGITYYNKSGLGIGATAYDFNDNHCFQFYQYAINPFYYYESKKLYTGLSYTRYINGAETDIGMNPFKNELAGTFKLLKPFIRPEVVIDFGQGSSTVSFDSTYEAGTIPHAVTLKAKSETLLKDLTLTFGGSHDFIFDDLFKKDDELSVKPSVCLNAGTGSNTVINSGSFVIRGSAGKHALQRSRNLSTNSGQPFRLETLSAATDIYYSINDYFIEPEIYADYYFPATTGNRVTFIYSLGAGISF